MRLHPALVVVSFLAASISAHGSTLVIDNFSCPDSVSVTGPVFGDNFISCPGSIGGEREDFFVFLNGPSSSVSTINSNPPTGAITGTFGSGITGYEGMIWSGSTTGWDLDLDLTGDSILVQLQSDLGGTISAALFSGPVESFPPPNSLTFNATFSGSPGYQDVLIPLTDPVVSGTGTDLADVSAIDLYSTLDGPGGSLTIDKVDAVPTPEPSTLLLTSICFLGILTRTIWRRSVRQ
jgi:hypothetical protein